MRYGNKLEGLPVVDAKRPLTIEINHGDVVRGKNKNPAACAAAKACIRETKCTKVLVHLGRTFIRMGNRYERYITPKSVRSEIIAFDRGAKFAEGEYTFRAPVGTERLGHTSSGTNTGRNKPRHLKKPRAKHHIVSGVRPFFSDHSRA